MVHPLNSFFNWLHPIDIFLLTLLALAFALDVQTKKIRNELVLIIFSVALFSWMGGFFQVASVQSALTAGLESSDQNHWLQGGLLSLILMFVICLPFYFFRVIGGGDFKLLLAISFAVPVGVVYQVAVWAFVWNAVFALLTLLTHGLILQAVGFLVPKNLGSSIGLMGFNASTTYQSKAIPFSLGIFLGYFCFLQAQYLGLKIF